MENFKLEKPDFSQIDTGKIVGMYVKDLAEYSKYIDRVSQDNYLYWDKVKYQSPPKGLTALEFWNMVKLIRNISSRPTKIKAENGKNFTWVRLNNIDEYLHKIDLKIGGEIFSHYQNIITTYGKQRLLTKSIIEEAIASSQLEGAVTTTPMAKRLILENRAPKDRSERMIVNNYKTMQAITDDFKNKPLSHETLFELHRLITKDTLDLDKQGRYRTDADGITINDQQRYIYHVPPKEVFLKTQIEELIKYANDETDEGFIHPIIKAIFIHFWIGYLHPFYDGNGRIARTLFYWYLLKKGYWAIQYLPISLVIRNAPDRYGMAFVYSEQDDLDMTYFFDFNIKKTLEALSNFEEYIKKKTIENTKMDSILHGKYTINERQHELLRYLIVKGNKSYITPSSFIELNKISRETASKDLRGLENLNLIEKKRVGKNMRYSATELLMSEVTQ